ncbi:MAG: Zn-dependent oligopeptidase [Myxococcales bacterium]|nr:Zn-dependent oligopeptidase [Myxococcales bacterium]MCB9644078.1 Zn-dependent oligopeptidase [Myxococcales bacterium]
MFHDVTLRPTQRALGVLGCTLTLLASSFVQAAPPASKPAKPAAAKPAAAKPTTSPAQIAKAPATTPAKVPYPAVSYEQTPQQITQTCKQSLGATQAAMERLAAHGLRKTEGNFHTTFLVFEEALAQMEDVIGPVYLLKSTSPNKDVRKACQSCLQQYFAFQSRLFARADLYKVLKRAADKVLAHPALLSQADKQLINKHLRAFIRNGAALPKEKSQQAAQLNAELSRLSMRFLSHLSEDKTTVRFTRDELKGMPDALIATMKRDKEGRYLMSMRVTAHYLALMRNGQVAAARERAIKARFNLQAEANTKVLEQMIAVRQKFAKLLGYETFAHYVLADRMAKSPKQVFDFLNKIRPQLRKKMDAELQLLLELKKKDDPKATRVEAWDWRYYGNQLKKTRYAVDNEAIRRYFPMNHVIKTVFTIYQTLLGVRFTEIKPARAWHPDVRLFAVHDNESGELVSHFYLDLFPRSGKYTHFAAFGFIGGRRLPNGAYQTPVSAVVGNWQKPLPGKQSLLSHDEVETFFHEFGHIMHQTLTRAPYGSIAGTSVKRDFVEAPSQMLENWTWEPAILKMLSKHVETGKPLPDATIQRMIRSKRAISGLFWTRQLFFATIDMLYHTRKGHVDTAALWHKTMQEVMPVTYIPGVRPAAGFGHLTGYAAGYYGYLWSKVYAQDMYTVFEKAGNLDPVAGRRYRTWILEPGSTYDPLTLITNFLGRPPKFDAFYRELGLK